MASQASFYTASVVVQDDDFAVGQANHDEIVGNVEAHGAFTKVNNLKLVCAAYNVFFFGKTTPNFELSLYCYNVMLVSTKQTQQLVVHKLGETLNIRVGWVIVTIPQVLICRSARHQARHLSNQTLATAAR